jgi:hypothetical protein
VTIDIAGLDKASVLAALYNRARPQGMGFLHYTTEPMTRDEAQAVIASGGTHLSGLSLHFDYLKGRVMKVDLSNDTFDPWLYDRDNGNGAAFDVVSELRRAAA